MAHQRKSINQKAHGGRVKGAAPGDAPNTGAPGPTPAPVRPVAPDVISRPRQPVGAGYGMSGGAENPSSINPGETLESKMASNLRASVNDGGELDRIQAGDGGVNLQTREVSAQPYPPANKGASAGPQVPAKLGGK